MVFNACEYLSESAGVESPAVITAVVLTPQVSRLRDAVNRADLTDVLKHKTIMCETM